MSTPGTNYLIREHNGLLLEGRLAVCNSTDKVFDTRYVTILDRSEDCTGFRCPACGGRHDNRAAPTGGEGRRMGYTELRPPAHHSPQTARRAWVAL